MTSGSSVSKGPPLAGSAKSAGHILVYEPRTEGHHPGWLRFITEDLLSANYRLTLAVDTCPEARAKLDDHLHELLSQVKLIHAPKAPDDTDVKSVSQALATSGAERVFLCAFDEIASGCWRRCALLGVRPPRDLFGRIGGIYHRPRFMGAPDWSLDRFLKRVGMRRLMRERWIAQLLFPDEFLARDLQSEFPEAPIYFLPDPCPEGFDQETAAARRQLQLPLNRRILLFFGTGARRKGLHLAVEAMLSLPAEQPLFLLCVGQQDPQGATAGGLERLVGQGRAAVFNRYVSAAEEKLSFEAADAVLLPYLNHFGTSGVLSRAAAAGKLVIASDEQYVGRVTRERRLGLLFASGDVGELRDCMRQVSQMGAAQLEAWRAPIRDYARVYSREAYRAALLKSLSGRNAASV